MTRPAASARKGPQDRVIGGALLVHLLFLSRIAVSQSAYGVALLAFVAKIRRGRRPVWPRSMLPLAAFALATLLSCLYSADPLAALPRMRSFLLYALFPLYVNEIKSRRLEEAFFQALFAAGTILSIWGIIQFFSWDAGTAERIRGPLSHWMTYAGILTLTFALLLGHAVFASSSGKRRLFAALALLHAAAIALTLTRGAYLAVLAALAFLCLIRKPRLLWLLPAILAILFIVSPRTVQERIVSIGGRPDETAVDRLFLWRSGISIIADHPLLGVGLSLVPAAYETRYRDPAAPKAEDAHLHNNILQLAAERGIPALLCWAWFFALLFLRLYRLLPGRDPAHVGALLALVAFHTFGLVEYNFGDSEILMMLFFLAAIPYLPRESNVAAHRGGASAAADQPLEGAETCESC